MSRTTFQSTFHFSVIAFFAFTGLVLHAQSTPEGRGQESLSVYPPKSATYENQPGRIIVLEGQGAHNSISSKTAIHPVIQLLNRQGRPVPNAEITFEAPPSGPGGRFGSGPLAVTTTDRAGQATSLFTPNEQAGRFAIQVRAKWVGGVSTATIFQHNDMKVSEPVMRLAKRPWYRDWRVWAAGGAAAGVGTWLARRNGVGGQSVITITPSPVVIGGAR